MFSSEEDEDTITAMDQFCKIKISQDSDEPTQGTAGSAAYDLRSKYSILLHHGQVTKVPLKLTMALPSNMCAMIVGRSGLAAKGILAHNGIIDPDYQGECVALLHNMTERAFPVTKGQRIAQMILLPVVPATWTKTDKLPPTTRQGNGLGSTGS